MREVRQIDIKNRTYYFDNDIIDLENFDWSLLKIDKKPYKDIGISNIGYNTIKKIDDCKNIHSVNPLYLRINHASGYFQEKDANKYLIIDSTDENKQLLKNIMTFLMELGIKSKKYAVMSVNMKTITWKLNLILMILIIK